MYLPPPLLRGQSHGLQPLPVKWKFHLKAGQSAVLWIFIEILGGSNHSPQIYYSRGWLKHRSPSGSSSCLACLGLKCINFLNHLNGHSGWQVDVAPTCPNNHMYMCTCVQMCTPPQNSWVKARIWHPTLMHVLITHVPHLQICFSCRIWNILTFNCSLIESLLHLFRDFPSKFWFICEF